jgi:hypothetical protein
MHRKRTIALLSLLLLIIIACVLLRATALTPSESISTEVVTEPVASQDEAEPTTPVEVPEETEPANPVSPQPPAVISPAPVITKGCYVGGCSSQICSENPDMASTCEWRESYACYQSATCERQSTGECGWTETPALNTCLLQAESNSSVSF